MRNGYDDVTIPLLSICIPTWNRCGLLEESLAVIVSEGAGLALEVCVFDNASSDQTAAMMAKWVSAHDWIHFSSQAANVGIDRNMEDVVRMSRGRFVWQLGDDDLIVEGMLPELLRDLADTSPDILILQGDITDGDRRSSKAHLPQELEGKCYREVKPAFRELWHRIKYGCFIVSRPVVERSWQVYEGTSHAYAGVIWDHLVEREMEASGFSVVCGSRRSVLLREVTKTYSSYRSRVLLRDIPLWISLLPNAIATEKKWLARKWNKSHASMRELRSHVASGQMNKANIDELMESFTTWQRTKARVVYHLFHGMRLVSRNRRIQEP